MKVTFVVASFQGHIIKDKHRVKFKFRGYRVASFASQLTHFSLTRKITLHFLLYVLTHRPLRRGKELQSHCEPSAHSKYWLPLTGQQKVTFIRGEQWKTQGSERVIRETKSPLSHMEPAHRWFQLSHWDGRLFDTHLFTHFPVRTHSVLSPFPHDMTATDVLFFGSFFFFFYSPWAAALQETSDHLKNKDTTGKALGWGWRVFSILRQAT